MVKPDELLVIRAIALCYKPWLKPEEALVYCNLGRTQFAKKCSEFHIFKSSTGYFRKEDLDRMLAGEVTKQQSKLSQVTLRATTRAQGGD
jgi:hypothetical protein